MSQDILLKSMKALVQQELHRKLEVSATPNGMFYADLSAIKSKAPHTRYPIMFSAALDISNPKLNNELWDDDSFRYTIQLDALSEISEICSRLNSDEWSVTFNQDYNHIAGSKNEYIPSTSFFYDVSVNLSIVYDDSGFRRSMLAAAFPLPGITANKNSVRRFESWLNMTHSEIPSFHERRARNIPFICCLSAKQFADFRPTTSFYFDDALSGAERRRRDIKDIAPYELLLDYFNPLPVPSRLTDVASDSALCLVVALCRKSKIYPNLNHKTDLYYVNGVFYTSVTWRDLFQGSDDVSVIQRISGTEHSIKYLKKCTDRENQDLLEELKVQVGPFYNPLGATNG
jgi:hypothetical protein